MVLSTSVGALAQLGARHTGSVEVTGSSPVYSIFLFPISKPVESRRVQYTFVISPNSRTFPYKIYMPTIGGKEKKYGKVHKKTSAESGNPLDLSRFPVLAVRLAAVLGK